MKKYALAGLMAATMLMPLAASAHTTFTDSQVSSIVSLLQAFGVEQSTIDEVYAILLGA